MSADLFAAFEEPSQPPPQQTQSKTPSTQPASTPFAFGLTSSVLAANFAGNQKWSQFPSVSNSNQFRHSWQAQPSAPGARPASVATGASANVQSTDNDDAEDDDGWGDFEVAPDTIPSPVRAPLSGAPIASNLGNIKPPGPAENTHQRPTRVVRASTMDLVSNSLVDLQDLSIQPSQPTNPPGPGVRPSLGPSVSKVHTKPTKIDPNVLFDADDFEEEEGGEGSDDDFGDFETVPTPAQPPPDLLSSSLSVPSSNTNAAKKASELLLDLDISGATPRPAQITQPGPVQAQPAIRKDELRKPKPKLQTNQLQNTHIRTKPQKIKNHQGPASHLPKQTVKSPPETVVGSTWDWDAVESPKPAKPKSPIKNTPKLRNNKNVTTTDTSKNEDTAWDWEPIDTKTKDVTEIDDSALPPINIPPPSILLSAFPQLFDQANEYLYKPVSGQPQTIKDRVLSDSKAHDFLGGYLSLAIVAAHIIAGRKLRWHRDKYLSQSMSISAAGSKGMKLAGVDKTQTVREDREAADVVSNWKSQVGRLRSMVAAANSANRSAGKQLKVPEITDTMQVQTAKDVPTAPKACVICGLKRNERLAKIDHDVEDSFGEWWVEHWGHVSCKRFWLQHENTLRQR